MTGCSAKGCTNRSEDGLILKCIPKDPLKRALWVKGMNSVLPKNGRLCENHFPEDQWDICGKKLKKHAVPSMFSSTTQHSPSPGIQQIVSVPIALPHQVFLNLKKHLKDNYDSDILKTFKTAIYDDIIYRSVQFPRCCNLKSKFAVKFMVYRLKIYSRRLKDQIKKQQRIKWSSKSHAMRDLIHNLKK